MRTIELPITDDDGAPMQGRMPLVGDCYDMIAAVTWFSGWRAGDWDAPADAPADWSPTPAEPPRAYDLGYAFAALLGMCWPNPLSGASVDDWRRYRSESSGDYSHVVRYGEQAFEGLVDFGIGQSDVFHAGRRLHRRLAELVPDVGKVSRLADFSPVLPGTSISG